MHEEELQAYKTATETTRDVKDLLASVTVATQSLKDIAIRVEEETTKASDHSGLIYEMSALKAVIAAERKNFASERERFTVMVQEMMKYNREQKEMSSNERLRLEAEIQRIETERRLLEEVKNQKLDKLTFQKLRIKFNWSKKSNIKTTKMSNTETLFSTITKSRL
jgi:hypothetical protein